MTRGFKFRLGVRIMNVGVRFRIHWIIKIGYKIKKKGMEEYV